MSDETETDMRRTATIKRFATQWFVCEAGARGGIAVASKKAGLELCAARGWRVVKEV